MSRLCAADLSLKSVFYSFVSEKYHTAPQKQQNESVGFWNGLNSATFQAERHVYTRVNVFSPVSV
jgi:hypothetical protein